MPLKRLVCLANSRKLNGRCVAGIEGFQGRRVGWIRPVSAREHEEVSEYERQYEDGSDPRPLDVMDVPLIEPRPEDYQQENWLLDPDSYWRRIEPLRWDHLHTLADPPAPLWVDGNSTYNGMNDRIPLTQAGEVRTSLRLLRVDRLMLPVFKPGGPSATSSAACKAGSAMRVPHTASGSPIPSTNGLTWPRRTATTRSARVSSR